MRFSKKRLSSEKGFALITAIMACVILFALAMLIINLSTGDLRVSARSVGDKKAMSAAETGTHQMMQNFNPDSTTWTAANNYTINCTATTPTYIWRTIASGADANTQYAICTPTGPVFLHLAGYSFPLGQNRYIFDVIGTNSSYSTRMEVGVAVGYSPIKASGDYE